MPKAQRGSGTTDITAPPDLVYDLIAVVTRTGEWSPKCYRYERLDGATPPRTRARSAASAGHSGTTRGRDATVSPCSSALHPTTLNPRRSSRRRVSRSASFPTRSAGLAGDDAPIDATRHSSGSSIDQSGRAWARIRFPRPRTRDGRWRSAAPRAPAGRSRGA